MAGGLEWPAAHCAGKANGSWWDVQMVVGISRRRHELRCWKEYSRRRHEAQWRQTLHAFSAQMEQSPECTAVGTVASDFPALRKR